MARSTTPTLPSAGALRATAPVRTRPEPTEPVDEAAPVSTERARDFASVQARIDAFFDGVETYLDFDPHARAA